MQRSGTRSAPRRTLRDLDGIGPAMERDLHRLGVADVATLARREPRLLYARLCTLTGQRQDPCVGAEARSRQQAAGVVAVRGPAPD